MAFLMGGMAAIIAAAAYAGPLSLEMRADYLASEGRKESVSLDRVSSFDDGGWQSEPYSAELSCEPPRKLGSYSVKFCVEPKSSMLITIASSDGSDRKKPYELSFYDQGADGMGPDDYVVGRFANSPAPPLFLLKRREGRIIDTWLDPDEPGHRHVKKVSGGAMFLGKLLGKMSRIEEAYRQLELGGRESAEALEYFVETVSGSHSGRIKSCSGHKND